MSYQLIPITHC